MGRRDVIRLSRGVHENSKFAFHCQREEAHQRRTREERCARQREELCKSLSGRKANECYVALVFIGCYSRATSVATSKIEHDASCQSLQGQAKIPRIKQDVDIM